MYCESIDEYEITEIIQNLKISKSAGPDNIGPKLIKAISHIIAKPLTHIYNLSFESGIVPDALKIAKLIPIFKKGDKTKLDNLEKLMYKRVNSFLLDNHILYDFQFGFCKNHSTSIALMEILDYIYQSLDAKLESDVPNSVEQVREASTSQQERTK